MARIYIMVMYGFISITACSADKAPVNEVHESNALQPRASKTKGPNRLAEDNVDSVWRFAVIPDTQGRADKWGVDRVTLPDGSTSHIGIDVNRDGFFDGNGYKINVENYWQPKVMLDEQGDPIRVATPQDLPAIFRHLPSPLMIPMINKIIKEKVDLVLAVGDMTDKRTESEFIEWMEIVAEPLLNAGISVYPVRGNHDVVDGKDWPSWFTVGVKRMDRESVNNVDNNINSYQANDKYDQGRKLYGNYTGKLIKQKLATGDVIGYPGLEELVYYFVHENTLFIAIDTYFSDLIGNDYRGTWITLYPWLKKVIESQRKHVDHIYVYAHEALLGKKRPHHHGYNLLQQYYRSSSTSSKGPKPGVMGKDMGQLGHMLLQSHTSPGLSNKILKLFNDNNITYIAGHDHQYSRSIVHSKKGQKKLPGFMQIIAGSASWKAYNNRYGTNADYETSLYQDNFVDPSTGNTNAVSFLVVEINGRQITYKNFHLPVAMNANDMTRGARWSVEKQGWLIPKKDGKETFVGANWKIMDYATFTSDAQKRLVSPAESYWFTSETPRDKSYIGTEFSILEGYNLTFNSHEVFASKTEPFKNNHNSQDDTNPFSGRYGDIARENRIHYRVDHLSEQLSVSWFVDNDNTTLSDIALIDGIQNQRGTFFDTSGQAINKVFSAFYFDKDGKKRKNPAFKKKLNNHTDAIAVSMTLNKSLPLTDTIIGHYDPKTKQWATAVDKACFIDTVYSDDFSVVHNGGIKFDTDPCALRQWGYNHSAHAVWGFINRSGRYALLKK